MFLPHVTPAFPLNNLQVLLTCFRNKTLKFNKIYGRIKQVTFLKRSDSSYVERFHVACFFSKGKT